MRIGITGGIGCGKTTVCRVFETLGIPVFESDKEAQFVIGSDPIIRNKLIEITGADLFPTGDLDRKLLANLIFNDKKLLEKVNQLIHPVVLNNFNKWSENQNAPYTILESAILFESGAWKNVDISITVTAPLEERIRRVSVRSNLDESEIAERIKNQMDDGERVLKSDFVIRNGEGDMIIPSILKIHDTIIQNITNNK